FVIFDLYWLSVAKSSIFSAATLGTGSRTVFGNALRRSIVPERTRSGIGGVIEPVIPNMRKERPPMPVVFIDAPPGVRPDAKTKMMEKITAAIDEAYHIGDTLVFLREHTIDNVAMDGRIQSDNPKILEALKKIQG